MTAGAISALLFAATLFGAAFGASLAFWYDRRICRGCIAARTQRAGDKLTTYRPRVPVPPRTEAMRFDGRWKL